MPNGHHGDHPLTDLLVHGTNHFPDDIAELILQLDRITPYSKGDTVWQVVWEKSWYWAWYTGWDQPLRQSRGKRWLKEQIAKSDERTNR
jgi:hypothetical protein